MELRCASKLHVVVLTDNANGIVEVSCDSRFCGKRPGVTVRHKFDLTTGLLTDTQKYNTQVRSK